MEIEATMYDDAAPLRSAARMTEPLPTPDAGAAARQAVLRVRKLLTGYLPGMPADPARLAKALAAPTEPESERLFALGWTAWLGGDWDGAHERLREARAVCEGESAAPCAYWMARVGILAGRGDAVAEYESAMRKFGGSPQATAWYVDLLFRAGRVDRAEVVWKTMRGNKRVLACDEGPLLEARSMLRRGELGPAEKLLREMRPASAVVHAERQFLLAWALAGLRKPEAAREALGRAAPYPARVVADWRRLVEARLSGASVTVPPAGWGDYLAGQEARKQGRREEAIGHYRAALSFAATQPYATYALACLGEADAQAVLAATPGAFFAARARILLATDRFRKREGGPGEFLEAVEQAARAGVEAAPFEPVRALARFQQARPGVAEVAAFADGGGDALRLALEQAARLPPADAAPLLARWLDLAATDDLRDAIRRHQLRCALLLRDASLLPAGAERTEEAKVLLAEDEPPALYPPVRLAVSLSQAAQRLDADAVAALLGDDGWRALAVPPRFALRSLAALAAAKPNHAAFQKALPAWLALWKPASLGPEGTALAGDLAAPSNVDADAWYRHQAARALLRDEPSQAVAMLRRAAVSLPAAERLAKAAALGRAFGVEPPGLLTDMVDLLSAHSLGASVLDAPITEAREKLAALAERPDAPARLLHHVALVESRLADHYAATDATLATLHARRSWLAWLGYFASPDAPPHRERSRLVAHLISGHGRRLKDHLARGESEAARAYWLVITKLPKLANAHGPVLGAALMIDVVKYRDDLATEYLLATREAMRFGDIPEGYRANYERGLTLLESYLALDRRNPRLLTALTETAADWFLDMYHLQEGRLFAEVERLAPYADLLAEHEAEIDSTLAARSALSEFWKFRGFAARDRQEKLAFYREALAFNPGNENVRSLLADLEADHDG